MIKKNILFGFIAIAMIFIIGSVQAYYVDVDYAYVRSDSYTPFLNVQYANYFDNVDFSYQLTGYGFSGNQQVYISPVIYGISPAGYMTQVMSVPTSPVYLYSANPYNYVYNNLFYFDADYLGYKIELNVVDLSGNPLANDVAYVYSSGTTPGNGNNNGNGNTNPTTITCDDFYLSGQGDIYLQEDDSTNYYLYMINTVNEELTVTSVTTTNPENLDIDNIDYPYTIGSYGTRSANIDMTASTVDSDFTGSFDVTVAARYDTLTCTKQYTVYYHIEDQDNTSNADCSDISFNNTSITMNENDTQTKEIEIENNSNDYDYVIESTSIKDTDHISADVTYEPSSVHRDSTGKIKVRLETEEVDNYLTEDVALTINGYMERSGHEDKHCKKTVNLPVRINDNSNNNTSSECSNIKIYTSNISQKENTSKDYTNANGFYISNKSNNKFNINEVSISDNSQFADIVKNTMNYAINANSQTSLNFNLKTFLINATTSSRGSVSVLGRFDNGISCTYSDIKSYFTINVLDSTDTCSNIIVQDKKVVQGENSITIQNNTNKEFGMNDVIVLNKNGLNVNVIDKATIIKPNSIKDIRVGVTGDGSANLQVKGKFVNGDTCEYTKTTLGTITTKDNINFQAGACDFEIDYPATQNIANARESLYLTFNNQSLKGGTISMSAYGAVVDPSVIYLDGYDDFTRALTLSNFNNPTYVIYNIKLNGCQEKIYTTKLTSSTSSDKKIMITSSPSVITPINNRSLTNVSILNTYNTEKNVTLKLAGLPDTWKIYENDSIMNIDLVDSQTRSKDRFTIGSNQTKTIYFGIVIPENEIKTKYNAYFELYESNVLVSKTQVTIDLTPILSDIEVTSKSLIIINDFENAYNLKITLKNNSSFSKDLEILFKVDENTVIDGEKLFTIDADSNKTIEYRIVTKTKLKDTDSVAFNVIDRQSGKLIESDSVTYFAADNKRKGLTAFFTFSTVSGTVGLIVLIIIVLLIIGYYIRRHRRRQFEKGVRAGLNSRQNI
ncbi:MAG: hypothetical protein WCF78_03820 [archaeon]